jgi:hypothetical protein
MDTPEQVPSSLIAGDLWLWTRDLSDYPASTWTLTYYFENKDKAFSIAGTPVGATHSFSIAAATTAAYPAGRYLYRVRAVNGSTIYTIEEGWVEVAPDPAAAGTRDTRTWARRVLEALEATIEGKASQDQLSMSINGRAISRLSPEELLTWRDSMRAEVRAEESALASGRGRTIRARFGRAS